MNGSVSFPIWPQHKTAIIARFKCFASGVCVCVCHSKYALHCWMDVICALIQRRIPKINWKILWHHNFGATVKFIRLMKCDCKACIPLPKIAKRIKYSRASERYIFDENEHWAFNKMQTFLTLLTANSLYQPLTRIIFFPRSITNLFNWKNEQKMCVVRVKQLVSTQCLGMMTHTVQFKRLIFSYSWFRSRRHQDVVWLSLSLTHTRFLRK